jgi:predicted NUDIX family NTP pyrophosphohydrolase
VFCGDGTGFLASDVDRAALVFGAFEMEWPPRSGRRQSFPEIDRVAWMPLAEARPDWSPGSGRRWTRVNG